MFTPYCHFLECNFFAFVGLLAADHRTIAYWTTGLNVKLCSESHIVDNMELDQLEKLPIALVCMFLSIACYNESVCRDYTIQGEVTFSQFPFLLSISLWHSQSPYFRPQVCLWIEWSVPWGRHSVVPPGVLFDWQRVNRKLLLCQAVKLKGWISRRHL